jgi:hypothetical protein
MEGTNNIYDKIHEILGNIPGNLTILEQQIDADIQLEYYNCARSFEEDLNPEEVLEKKDRLFIEDLTIDEKKLLIVQLAGVDSIEAYRTLEKFLVGPAMILKEWTTLALQENKLLLESKLLDESQVLISTGLGGKGLKLRYFTVLFSRTGKHFNAFEQRILTSELGYTVEKCGGELEQLQFDRELCRIMSIIPLPVPVQELFDGLIEECNQYGDFLHRDYIITNVKVFASAEIRKKLRKKRIKETPPGAGFSGQA